MKRVEKPRKASTDWVTNGSVLVHAVRTLSTRGSRSVLMLEREDKVGEVEVAQGMIVGVRFGRLGGQDAFNNLLMWADATYQVHAGGLHAANGARADNVIDIGLEFVSQLDGVAYCIGGPRSTFAWSPKRLAELATTLPPPVRAFAAGLADGTLLVDVVAESSFQPADTLKIVYRLCELGVFEVDGPSEEAPSLASQIALVDWVLEPKKDKGKIESSKRPRADSTERDPTDRKTRSATQRVMRVPSTPIPRHELSFDDMDRAFFAREIELEPEPVDSFEDLEDTATRRKLDKDRFKL